MKEETLALLAEKYFALKKRRALLKKSRISAYGDGCEEYDSNCWYGGHKQLDKKDYCDTCKARNEIHEELMKNASQRAALTRQIYCILEL